MRLIFFITCVLVIISSKPVTCQLLFPISHGGYYGFIDSVGNTVIKPRFVSAGKFSNGLAPARINGLYGYVNTEGKWAIQPQYEYANSFINGRAIVYDRGRPLFIDRANQQYAMEGFFKIEPFNEKLSVATSSGGKQGLLNPNGELTIDTIYDNLFRIKPGYFIASIYYADSTGKLHYKEQESIFIDSIGKEFIRLNENKQFKGADDSLLLINRKTLEDQEIKENILFIYNYSGELILEKELELNDVLSGGIVNGTIKINRYPLNERGEREWNAGYQVLLTIEGKLLLDDSSYSRISNMKSNRIFIQKYKGHSENVNMLNTKGEIVSKTPFDNYELFDNGYAFVRTGRCEGVIDTNGNYTFNPEFDQAHIISDEYFIYRHRYTDWCYGIARFSGEKVTPTIFQDYHVSYENGLFLGLIDDKPSYVNTMGEVIWQQKELKKTASPQAFDIDYMNRGYFHAYSKKRKNELGGHASSRNYPKDIPSDLDLPKGQLTVKVVENTNTVYRDKYKGLKVIVANSTKKDVEIDAQDSRLYMVMQAQTPEGEWRDIEYTPNSWCGNSYHTLVLPPSMYWEFTAPQYHGSVKTKLRIRLSYNDPTEVHKKQWERTMLTTYSNEFEASVNPAQFWRKAEYAPQGIMDPYMD